MPKGMIYMTTSNARKIDRENKERKITVISRKRDKSLRMQKLAGAAVIAASLASVFIGGELSAAAVLMPPALAAVFSKDKLLDFNIFGR